MDSAVTFGIRGMTVEASRKIGKSGEPWYLCNNEFHSAIFAWPCVLSVRRPVLWWLSPGEGWDAVGINCKRAQLLNIKAQMSRIWANGCLLIIMCVLPDLT